MFKTIIIVYKRGNNYYCDAHGKFGGGYTGANFGTNERNAAALVDREIVRYGLKNKKGYVTNLPPEIAQHVKLELVS